jgi:alpha-ketoglutarate-dependent taurine dioxygenase
VPEQNGNTEFIDLEAATNYLRTHDKELFEALSKFDVLVETSKIADFAPLFQSNMEQRASLHPIIHVNPFNGREYLFLSDPNNSLVGDADPPMSLSELISKFVNIGKT